MQTGYTPTNLETLPVNTCTNYYSKKILTLLYKMKKWNPKTTSKIELREFNLRKLMKGDTVGVRQCMQQKWAVSSCVSSEQFTVWSVI